MPSMIFLYPVQRQRLPRIAVLISSSVGSGFCLSNPAALMTIPGVQKPHWTDPLTPNA